MPNPTTPSSNGKLLGLLALLALGGFWLASTPKKEAVSNPLNRGGAEDPNETGVQSEPTTAFTPPMHENSDDTPNMESNTDTLKVVPPLPPSYDTYAAEPAKEVTPSEVSTDTTASVTNEPSTAAEKDEVAERYPYSNNPYAIPTFSTKNNAFPAKIPTGKAPQNKAIVAPTFPLKIGSRGVYVKTLQKKLGIKADGVFGAKTEASLLLNFHQKTVPDKARYHQIINTKTPKTKHVKHPSSTVLTTQKPTPSIPTATHKKHPVKAHPAPIKEHPKTTTKTKHKIKGGTLTLHH